MDSLVRKCRVDGIQYPADYEQLCEACFGDAWTFWCSLHAQNAEEQGCPDCAYKFDGRLYFDTKSLGTSFFACWPVAKSHIAKKPVSTWILETLGNRVLGGKLRAIERDESLSQVNRSSLIVMLLIGDEILRWDGSVVDYEWFRFDEDKSIELLKGNLATLIADLELGTWLLDIKKHWSSLLAAISDDPEPERTAFRLLFSRSTSCNLSASLSAAQLAPRFHVPHLWKSKSQSLAKLASTIGDEGYLLPDNARLKVLFSSICKSLRNGTLPEFHSKHFYDCTLLLAWRYEGKTLLEHSPFRQHLWNHLKANPDGRFLRSLVFGYLREFDLSKPEFVSLFGILIRDYLVEGTTSEFEKWKSLDSVFNLFSGNNTPAECAKHLTIITELEEALRGLGFTGAGMWGGLSAEILLAWIRVNGAYQINDWVVISSWFEKCIARFSHREHEWLDAAILAWSGKSAPGNIRSVVSRHLVDRFGEPEVTEGVWRKCSPEVLHTVNQWLLFENLEKFFDLIASYAETSGGEMGSQWSYRKAFWLAVHKTGEVIDIRIAAGNGIMRALGAGRLRDRFGSKLVKLDDSDERRCALILKIGTLVVVDFTHNAKCRVWPSGKHCENWFESKQLLRNIFQDGKDLIIRSHYSDSGIAHFSSENYGWQDAMADFFRRNSKISLSREDYQIADDARYIKTSNPATSTDRKYHFDSPDEVFLLMQRDHLPDKWWVAINGSVGADPFTIAEIRFLFTRNHKIAVLNAEHTEAPHYQWSYLKNTEVDPILRPKES